MRTTTNRKEIIAKVQETILEYFDGSKEEFAEQVEYLLNQHPDCPTLYHTILYMVQGGMFACYSSTAEREMAAWGLNPERYSDDKNWQTYCHLIARDGERFYNKIKKQAI